MHSGKKFSFIRDMSRGDHVEIFMKAPFRKENGFVYSNDDAHMLAAAVTRVAGEPLADYLAPRLFEPLKSALLRLLGSKLDPNAYLYSYIADSSLTPRKRAGFPVILKTGRNCRLILADDGYWFLMFPHAEVPAALIAGIV
jgi:CubicO group peptidase (beta-lactamase class C family)